MTNKKEDDKSLENVSGGVELKATVDRPMDAMIVLETKSPMKIKDNENIVSRVKNASKFDAVGRLKESLKPVNERTKLKKFDKVGLVADDED